MHAFPKNMEKRFQGMTIEDKCGIYRNVVASQKLMGRDTQMATQPDKEPYSRAIMNFPNPSNHLRLMGGGNSSLSRSLLVNR